MLSNHARVLSISVRAPRQSFRGQVLDMFDTMRSRSIRCLASASSIATMTFSLRP